MCGFFCAFGEAPQGAGMEGNGTSFDQFREIRGDVSRLDSDVRDLKGGFLEIKSLMTAFQAGQDAQVEAQKVQSRAIEVLTAKFDDRNKPQSPLVILGALGILATIGLAWQQLTIQPYRDDTSQNSAAIAGIQSDRWTSQDHDRWAHADAQVEAQQEKRIDRITERLNRIEDRQASR